MDSWETVMSVCPFAWGSKQIVVDLETRVSLGIVAFEFGEERWKESEAGAGELRRLLRENLGYIPRQRGETTTGLCKERDKVFSTLLFHDIG